jgi:hypothetical protein
MPAKPRPRKTRRSEAAPQPSLLERLNSNRAIIFAFAVAVLLFYWRPLFDAGASIQWDAVDVHYSSQKYFSDFLRSGKLPFWTPHIFSGMPFLADPQVGAWYPLNWPFFLLGITPRSIQWETALHCFLALTGAYLLALDLLGSRIAAVFAGAFFAFAGFFAGHSSHTGIFQAAALLPWLLWTGLRAIRAPRWLPAAGLAAGCLVLTGHFQTALYAFLALFFAVAADTVATRRRVPAAIAVLACCAVCAALLPAIMTLPGLELTGQSERAHADYTRDSGAALVPGALLTLVSPDHYGIAESETYTGPQDITQFFLYQGILLLPLAAVGLAAPKVRWAGLALLVPALWYSFGPAGGFYSVVARLPGLRSVRAPIHIWFVAALGLALLAAAGVQVLRQRFRSPWITAALLVIVAGDLWYWNMDHNVLAYSRDSFEQRYGSLEDRFRAVSAPFARDPLYRLWAPYDSPAFGPLNGTLDNRLEATFGYNPLALARYNRYIQAASGNPKLLDSLAVTTKLNASTGAFEPNSAALPRISVPETVTLAANQDDAAARLPALDADKQAVAEAIPASIAHNGPAQVRITAYTGDSYRVSYQAAAPTLLRIAVPYFPGWRVEIDGRPQLLVPVDFALMGVLAPAGNHELMLRYRSNWFLTGMLVSLVSWLAILAWLCWGFRAPAGPPPQSPPRA